MKTIYTSGWEINLNDESAFQDFIHTQAVKYEKAIHEGKIVNGLEIKFENDRLVSINDLPPSNHSKIISALSQQFKFVEVVPRRLTAMTASIKESNSYLGGIPTHGFNIPKDGNIKVPFQYLGKLSSNDDPFNWIGMDNLQLVYPLFAGLPSPFYLDYEDPKNPTVILTDEEYAHISYPFGVFPTDLLHQFEKTNLNFPPIEHFEDDDILSYEIGVTGAPTWIQYPQFPRCPKSGNLMKFVCQINTSETIKAKKIELPLKNKNSLSYMKSLTFGSSGSLYIFLEPTHKTVCILIQDT